MSTHPDTPIMTGLLDAVSAVAALARAQAANQPDSASADLLAAYALELLHSSGTTARGPWNRDTGPVASQPVTGLVEGAETLAEALQVLKSAAVEAVEAVDNPDAAEFALEVVLLAEDLLPLAGDGAPGGP